MAKAIVTEWHGTYLVEDGRMIRSVRAPDDVASLVARARLRRAGSRTPEEETMLGSRATEAWVSRDRRLVGPGVEYDPRAPGRVSPGRPVGPAREYLIGVAEESLAASWDPSIHVEEAVRAARDLDRAANLVGERLASWVSRDTPETDATDADGAARLALEEAAPSALAPVDPALREARQTLARLYRSLRDARAELDAAVAASVPSRTPNLHHLLGPELTGLLLAQAGGLDRLARLPASTIQVLGAERAFFAHLRGRAPPPRHGLLFLFPAIQSAPRRDRGKLARTLAGKVAIAARMDARGAEVDPTLREAFDRREAGLRGRRTESGGSARADRSRLPLDGASGDR